MRIRSSIAARTTQLAWMITLASLCLFIVFNIPGQKHDLEGGLESKAQSIAASLQGEVASAAATEDYSSVVEHALQAVSGDPAVEFIVIAKSDGYSIIVKRDGWTIVPQIDSRWYKIPRAIATNIGFEPLVGKRVFSFSQPLDCLGVPWGSMHIGLSLSSYDKSVFATYTRTGLLGVACILTSLFASILFAKRFVRPILDLRKTVEKVAHGDLEARSSIQTHDEIEQLGKAFNDMADAILQRDQIVESVRFAAQILQGADEWDSVMDKVLAQLGQATRVSRILLIQNENVKGVPPTPEVRLEWEVPGVAPYGAWWAGRNILDLGLAARQESLENGVLLTEHHNHLLANPIPGPDPQPMSRIAAPIFAEGVLWGVLVVQDCFRDRDWSDVEQNSVRAIADMVGACIVRERAKSALVEAKSELEQRVEERTLELREQIAARDKAHAELQQMQKQMIDLSRLSGMAEVATGVLHNVGNVLNSVNVSATLLTDRLKTSRVTQLPELSAMLTEKASSLQEFVTTDPRGQRVIPYLAKLSVHLLEERDLMKKESEALVQNVGHIKEIVSMQQGYARAYGILEKVAPRELIEDAVNIARAALDRHQIVVKREIEEIDSITTDRHTVLQILLNLIQNAKDAIKEGKNLPREITLRICLSDYETVRFEVEDNGVGIPKENLTKIFAHGFTTKDFGHGFGLHSGALAASQLGGSLRAKSDGPGRGAVFTLELPCHVKSTGARGGIQ